MHTHHLDLPQSATRAPAPTTEHGALSAAHGTVPVSCITSDQLLRGGNEVLIEHHGALYRLRQTSLGKLILTK